jgi:hypothetical protein
MSPPHLEGPRPCRRAQAPIAIFEGWKDASHAVHPEAGDEVVHGLGAGAAQRLAEAPARDLRGVRAVLGI